MGVDDELSAMDVGLVAGEMDLSDRSGGNLVEPRAARRPDVIGADEQIVQIDQQAATGAIDQTT